MSSVSSLSQESKAAYSEHTAQDYFLYLQQGRECDNPLPFSINWPDPAVSVGLSDIGLHALQAAKEVAHLHSSHLWSTKGQGSSAASTALPVWQEQALMHLNLYGPNANLEVLIGGDPPIDPRLLAAVRMLYCQDPTELGGRALVQLGAWGAFLTPANEVHLCSFLCQSNLALPTCDTSLNKEGDSLLDITYYLGNIKMVAASPKQNDIISK